MTAYTDTSGFLALLDVGDEHHAVARDAWRDLVLGEVSLVCNNHVLVECLALLQHRLGLAAVKAFQDDVVPLLTVEWLDESDHQAGVSALLTANRRTLSLVDCTSFETMRRRGIPTAFTLDRHFAEQGFECVP